MTPTRVGCTKPKPAPVVVKLLLPPRVWGRTLRDLGLRVALHLDSSVPALPPFVMGGPYSRLARRTSTAASHEAVAVAASAGAPLLLTTSTSSGWHGDHRRGDSVL